MKRILTAALIAVSMAGCQTVQLTETPRDKTYSGLFDVAGKTVPLPPGDWVVAASVVGSNNADDPILDTILVPKHGDTLTQFVAVKTNLSPGFNPDSEGYAESTLCNRSDFVFRKVYANEENGRQDCWGIYHYPFFYDSRNKLKHWEEARQYIINNFENRPNLFILLFYKLANNNDAILVSYGWNPDIDGIEPAIVRSWTGNEWHADYIDNYPDKKEYIEKLKTWGASWRLRVKNGFPS